MAWADLAVIIIWSMDSSTAVQSEVPVLGEELRQHNT